jgi:hypothetical protein
LTLVEDETKYTVKNEWNFHGSCGAIQNERKKPTRTVGCIGKRVIAAWLGVIVAAITGLSQGRCQIASEQQRRRIEEEHLG